MGDCASSQVLRGLTGARLELCHALAHKHQHSGQVRRKRTPSHPWGCAHPMQKGLGWKLCAGPQGERLPVTSWVSSTAALSAAMSQRLMTGHLSALVASLPISFLSRHLTLLASPRPVLPHGSSSLLTAPRGSNTRQGTGL